MRELYRHRRANADVYKRQLYALENSRAEGAVRGLVQAATGVGKTYLAAFDSAGYKRVLFVAHREEILQQAAVSFRNVRRSEDYGFFDGKHKDTDKSVVFASVFTLGRPEYLTEEFFAPDAFDSVSYTHLSTGFHSAEAKKVWKEYTSCLLYTSRCV